MYIDIILYIPALILFYNFPRFIMYYYTISPRLLAFSLLPGVFAVDALEVLRLGSLAGPVCGSFLALSPLAVRGSGGGCSDGRGLLEPWPCFDQQKQPFAFCMSIFTKLGYLGLKN